MVKLYNVGKKIQCPIKVSSEYLGDSEWSVSGIIDTGCQTTRLSVCSLFGARESVGIVPEHKKIMLRKARSGDGSVELIRGVGVNDKRIKIDLYSLSDDEILSRADIGFKCSASNLSLAGESFGETTISLYYKEGSPNLIGMSLLGNLDWDYNSKTSIFTISSNSNTEKDRIRNTSCIEKIKDLLFNKKYTIGQIEKELIEYFPKQSIDYALCEVMQDLYYRE